MQRINNALPWTFRALSLPANLRWPSIAALPTALGIGLVLTLLQVLLACAIAGKPTFTQSYDSLYAWDGAWYAVILESGYHSPPVMTKYQFGNVAFFPGYPLTARLVHKVTGTSSSHALLVVAQMACWGLWTFLLLFFQRWNVPPCLALVGVLLLLAHPATVFLVASYSESLFLLCMLGFLYFVDQDTPTARMAAALFGCLMTATRLVGVPLAAYPLLRGWLNRSGNPAEPWSWKRACPWLAVACITGLGAVMFFAYCQFRFGRWNLYMLTEEVGWGVHADYLAVFTRRVLHLHWPKLVELGGDPEWFSRVSVPVTMLLFAGFFGLECLLARGDSTAGWRQRAGYYFCAAFLFYICVSGHATRGLSSMLRFSLPVHVMFIMAALDLFREPWRAGRLRSTWAAAGLTLWCVLSFVCQVVMTYRFTHWLWVA
jgi:hypothetical protein